MKKLFDPTGAAFVRRVARAAARASTAICLLAGVLLTAAHAQLPIQAGTATSSVVQNEQVRAELVAFAPEGVGDGKPVWAGLQIRHQPQWHTYWKNPGDSGLPTILQWTLPPGIAAGEIAWPTPSLIRIGALGNYGYSDTVLLPVPLAIGKEFAPSAAGDLEIGLKASWLVCKQECIPQEGSFVLRVPARGSSALHAAAFAAAQASHPKPLQGNSEATVTVEGLTLTVAGLPASWQGKTLQVFPETPNIAEPSTSPKSQNWQAGRWTALLPLSVQREGTADDLPVVLVSDQHSLRTVARILGTWPPLPEANAALPVAVSAPSTRPAVNPPVSLSGNGWGAWGWALTAAVLGGLLLNLMPCVLPVLAIKVLGFAQHGGAYRSVHRAQGLAYTAGVVLSFVALGGLMLALRAAGEQLGWGFQLQSPGVIAALATLFTLLGLNLVGVFDVGSLLPHRLASLQARHPTVDAFLSGVLAVAIASPCTAPFMGASLGYAITLPAGAAIGIFAALGFGLALPFLLASWIPAVGRWLPRPGAWMNTLRRFMAFPMFATVVWLLWVLGHLTGVDGAASLLALLLALALLLWSLGLEGRSRSVLAAVSVVVCLAVGYAVAANVLQEGETTVANATATPTNGGADTALWQPWTSARAQAAMAQGQAVFVDFTAAWCITCQYNKKTTLSQPEVLADFRNKQVLLLRADWTRRDPSITAALEQLGRSGVPVYVLYQKDHAPVVFSEILNAGDLRDAVAKL
ncbi:MAG: thioredoxin family protein [Rhodoferax sp.]|nr:thioredoxin family protein [Rhodoferax sp.]